MSCPLPPPSHRFGVRCLFCCGYAFSRLQNLDSRDFSCKIAGMCGLRVFPAGMEKPPSARPGRLFSSVYYYIGLGGNSLPADVACFVWFRWGGGLTRFGAGHGIVARRKKAILPVRLCSGLWLRLHSGLRQRGSVFPPQRASALAGNPGFDAAVCGLLRLRSGQAHEVGPC
jgi:hypothetical protein